MAMLVMRWLTGALLLFACGRVGGCPLCLDSQGYASAQELVSRQRAQMALPGTGGAPPDVINAIRDEVPTAGAGYRLDRDAAGNAVLAQLGDNGTPLKVVEVIRGEMPAGGTIEPSWVIGLPRNAAPSVKPLLLIRARKWQSWANVGPIGVEHAEWLRKLAAAKRTTDTDGCRMAGRGSPSCWPTSRALNRWRPKSLTANLRERLTLHCDHSKVASTYWRCANGPPILGSRSGSRCTRCFWVLGVTRLTPRAWSSGSTLRGKPWTRRTSARCSQPTWSCAGRHGWHGSTPVHGRSRSDTRRSSRRRLLALSVQGGANATIPRERVIESYRRFIERAEPFAGFVAQDLAAWNYWDAGPEYVALLRSDLPQHPASRYAMWSYLKQSPRADARAAADAMAASAK